MWRGLWDRLRAGGHGFDSPHHGDRGDFDAPGHRGTFDRWNDADEETEPDPRDDEAGDDW